MMDNHHLMIGRKLALKIGGLDNVPKYYDLFLSSQLKVNSVTIQWMPSIKCKEGKQFSIHKFIIGTQSHFYNFLFIASMYLPKSVDQLQIPPLDVETLGYDYKNIYISLEYRIFHEGNLNRARYMPQFPTLIATKSNHSKVFIFDVNKHPALVYPEPICKPSLILNGLTTGGYGLSWNPNQTGYILSSSREMFFCLWDILKNPLANGEVGPLNYFKGHLHSVMDVAWHNFSWPLFGSVSYDQKLQIWDIRNHTMNPSCAISARIPLNCISFNRKHEYLFATGSVNKRVAVWDLRFLGRATHLFDAHIGEVSQIVWSPDSPDIFATGGTDQKLHIWNISKFTYQIPYDCTKPYPHFTHHGHCDPILDFSWHENWPWLINSVSCGHNMQIWKVKNSIM